MSGASNKEAGRTLGIRPRTIEVHRARIMEKLGAKNAADLVRIVLAARRTEACVRLGVRRFRSSHNPPRHDCAAPFDDAVPARH